MLSGGGSYGAFELGVLRNLATDTTVGVGCANPVVLAGTSVGAFNAAVLACRMAEHGTFCDAVADLSAIWTKSVGGDLHDNGVFRVRGDLFYSVNSGLPQWPIRAMAAAASDAAFMALDVIDRVRHLGEPAKLFDLSAAFCTDPLVGLIRRHVSWEQLRKSPCSLRVVTTNWTTGRPCEFAWQPKPGRGERHTHPEVVDLNEKNLCAAVEASTAIPGVFRPVHVPGNNGKAAELFVDGGLVMNSPIDPVIEAGANIIHLHLPQPGCLDNGSQPAFEYRGSGAAKPDRDGRQPRCFRPGARDNDQFRCGRRAPPELKPVLPAPDGASLPSLDKESGRIRRNAELHGGTPSAINR